jgi:hypothetical protein
MPANELVANMSFEDWQNRNGRFGTKTWEDLDRDPGALRDVDRDLERAVAYYLYIESKDVADDEAGLFRAVALALLKKPVDPDLLAIAGRRKSNDDPLYRNDYGTDPTLSEVWEYHHRVKIDSGTR